MPPKRKKPNKPIVVDEPLSTTKECILVPDIWKELVLLTYFAKPRQNPMVRITNKASIEILRAEETKEDKDCAYPRGLEQYWGIAREYYRHDASELEGFINALLQSSKHEDIPKIATYMSSIMPFHQRGIITCCQLMHAANKDDYISKVAFRVFRHCVINHKLHLISQAMSSRYAKTNERRAAWDRLIYTQNVNGPHWWAEPPHRHLTREDLIHTNVLELRLRPKLGGNARTLYLRYAVRIGLGTWLPSDALTMGIDLFGEYGNLGLARIRRKGGHLYPPPDPAIIFLSHDAKNLEKHNSLFKAIAEEGGETCTIRRYVDLFMEAKIYNSEKLLSHIEVQTGAPIGYLDDADVILHSDRLDAEELLRRLKEAESATPYDQTFAGIFVDGDCEYVEGDDNLVHSGSDYEENDDADGSNEEEEGVSVEEQVESPRMRTRRR